jgi:hypothetical protein
MDQRGPSDKALVDGYSDIQLFPRQGVETPCEVALDIGNRRSYEWVKVSDVECDPTGPDWPNRFARVARVKARRQRFGDPVLADIECTALVMPGAGS